MTAQEGHLAGPDPGVESARPDPELLRIIDAARDRWVRRLIDFSRANSLLFYRDLKVGTFDLSDHGEALARLLDGDALTSESLAPAAADAPPGDAVSRPRAEQQAAQKVRHTLTAIQRKAMSNLEEKGIETLHLALGMAMWPASDGGRPYEAPVLLLPARIEARGRAGDELRVKVAGEPQINPVLLFALEESHGVLVDGVTTLAQAGGEDDSGHWRVEPDEVFRRVTQAASGVPGFEIRRRAILANFQFAKMAMVEDLKKNGAAMAASTIVAAIAGHAGSRSEMASGAGDLDPAMLDARPPSDDYLVLDADSTQQRAIVLAGQGRNGVVHGPPGTGKSQTIANLIAQSVADGRRVLFVAEKRAALDAVIKRLNHPAVGLGHVILDLHGAAVSRRDVMARLAKTLDNIWHAHPVGEADAVHQEFAARRKQLNEHARRVNVPRQPTGMSVNRMLGVLLMQPEAARSILRLRGASLEGLTRERAVEVRRWILDGSAHPELLLGTNPSPWNNARIMSGADAQAAVDLVTKAAGRLCPDFERVLGEIVPKAGVAPTTLSETERLTQLLEDVSRVLQNWSPDVFASRPGELGAALAPSARGVLAAAWATLTSGHYREARRRLRTLRKTPTATVDMREGALLAEDVLRRWKALGSGSEMPIEIPNHGALRATLAAFSEATSALARIIPSGELGDMPLADLCRLIRALAGDRETPYRLPAIHDLRSKFASSGLTPFLDDLRQGNVPPRSWIPRFEYVWHYSTLESVLASDPGLAGFSGRTHEQVVEEFNRLDRERVRLAAERVRRVHAERAIAAMNEHPDQANLVRGEALKKTRLIALRDLFARAPDVLTRVAPCWVASPLSVSQLLDGGARHFDVVIFDEASQVLQEEAIPALYRAGQVVVAGDRHQLPPTTFFATSVDEDREDGDEEARAVQASVTEAIGGYESLLDTLEAFLSPWLLEWHYRSEDERLIAFSNFHIYDRRLITFPSARGHQAIRHILVPHDPSLGAEVESASREVDEVVRQVLDHAERRSAESLGVITMGIKHANRLQAALDRALEIRPDLADFFSLEREERFFVKNLETVQGDERDAIILSIGYGKNANGDLPHRFGPLTHEAGHRRLNVAVTRARRRMCVVSSFAHQEVDLERSGSRGVQLLKAYLEYAAKDGALLPPAEVAGEVGLNAFEGDIRDALERRGIATRPQFGASRYRIDLVAMHPEKPGRPVLAIECDGASYHSSATARDRDRLRQTHLQRLGWRFHRIWSTDWFYRREEEIARAVAAHEEAVRLADEADADETAGVSGSEAPSRHRELARHPTVVKQRGLQPRVATRETIEEYTERELLQLAEWVASDGLLRTDEDLIREIFDLLPFERMGSRIRARLEAVARRVRQGNGETGQGLISRRGS